MSNVIARRRMVVVLRVALLAGFAIDFFVFVVTVFFPKAMKPLFDIPYRDPTVTLLGGGELLVVSLLYLALFRAPYRFRPLLLLVALDQTLATVLPVVEISRGHLAATWKTVGPLPITAALAAVYVMGLRWVRNARGDL